MKKVNTRIASKAPETLKRARASVASDHLSGDPPAYQEIAALAYTYWEGRGYQGGSAEEDWLRAEEELRNRHTQTRAPKEPRADVKSAGA